MEEILSSIKRIIAEDADGTAASGAQKARGRAESHRKAVVAGMAGDIGDLAPSYVDEVLELTDEMPKLGKSGEAEHGAGAAEDMIGEIGETALSKKAAGRESIVSVESEIAARSSLAALSSMIVSSSEPGENTLEGLVREMLRPMLKEWLDANLPTLVEGMVAKEIARITGRPL